MSNIIIMYKHIQNGYYVNQNGTVKRKQGNRVSKPKLCKTSQGYICFIDFTVNKRIFVHRAVATCFIPKIKGKWEVDHINKIRNDNRMENLRWVSHQENMDHRRTE